MNSPSTALVWELWRKNRWGFAALLIILGVCGLISWQARRMQARAEALGAHDPNHIVIPSSQLFAEVPRGGSTTLRVKFGRKVVFDGILQRDHALVADAHFSPGLRLAIIWEPALNAGRSSKEATAGTPQAEQVFYDGPISARVLTWSVGGRPEHTVRLNIDLDYSAGVIAAQSAAEGWRQTGFAWSVGLLSFGVLLLLGIFGSAEPHPRLGFTGLPPRRFTLPVSTAALVAWPVGLGWLAVALFYLGWSQVVGWGLLAQGVSLANGYYTLLLMAGLVWFQALVWGLPSFPKTRAWLMTILVLLVIVLAAMAPLSTNLIDFPGWGPWMLAGLGLAWISGAGLACLAVRLERRGTWSGWARSSLWGNWMRALLPRPFEFRSPAEAQLWIEWRRNGRLALGIWAGLIVLLTAWNIAVRRVWGTEGVYEVGFVGSFAWVAVVGLNLARDPASGRLALSSFTAVRPVTSGALVWAKVRLGASLWAKAMIILGLGWLVSLNFGEFPENRSAQAAVVFLAISLHVFVGILPFCLTGRWPGFPWSVLPLLLVYGLLLNAIIWTEEHRQFEMLFAIAVALLVAKLVMAYWGFRRALRMRIASWRFVSGYVVFWIAAAGLLVWLAYRAAFGPDWPSQTIIWIPASALVVPLARVALSPLALAMNRHR